MFKVHARDPQHEVNAADVGGVEHADELHGREQAVKAW